MLKRISLPSQVLIAIGLAIFAGVFFGDLCSIFKPVGDIYLMLLMLVVLPFVATGLIYGLGSLSLPIAKRVLLPSLLIFIGLTALTIAFINYSLLFIPASKSLIFVATSEKTSSVIEGVLQLIIPSNIFSALTNNYISAVAVFGLIIGLFTIFIKEKESFLSVLKTVNRIILNTFAFLGKVSPIAIFCLLADMIGTISFGKLEQLVLYFAIYIGATLVLSLGILPYLLSSLTGFSYRKIMKQSSQILLIVCTTTMPSLSLPYLVAILKEESSRLIQPSASGMKDESAAALPEALSSLSYNFSQLGNLFIILFMTFASFFYRTPIHAAGEWLLNLLAIPMGWGGPSTSINGVTFLSPMLGISSDSLTLFFNTNALTRNFQALISAMGMYCFSLIALFSCHKQLKIRWGDLIKRLCVVAVALGLFVAAAKIFHWGTNARDRYIDYYNRVSIQDVVSHPPKSSFPPKGSQAIGDGTLESILTTQVLRVGYNPETKPYCFWSDDHQLVGYDIAFAYELASTLGCQLEFIPFEFPTLADDLLNNRFDIGMSAIVMTAQRLKEIDFSNVYANLENVLIVKSADLHQFTNFDLLKQRSDLVIGGISAFSTRASGVFPLAKAVNISSPDELLSGKIDAVFWSLLQAQAWVYSHPDYQIVSLTPHLGTIFFAYAIHPQSGHLLEFANNWLQLQEQSGFTEKQKKFWLEGQALTPPPPRWSIIRNVLHWVD